MDFSQALRALLGGRMATRTAQELTGRWVVLRAGYPDGIPVNEATAEAVGVEPGTVMVFRRYLLARYPDGTLGPWSIAQEDVLAQDWEVVE